MRLGSRRWGQGLGEYPVSLAYVKSQNTEGERKRQVSGARKGKRSSLLYTVQNRTQLGRMYTALCRGSSSNRLAGWSLSALEMSTLRKRSKCMKEAPTPWQGRLSAEVQWVRWECKVELLCGVPWWRIAHHYYRGGAAQATEDSSQPPSPKTA